MCTQTIKLAGFRSGGTSGSVEGEDHPGNADVRMKNYAQTILVHETLTVKTWYLTSRNALQLHEELGRLLSEQALSKSMTSTVALARIEAKQPADDFDPVTA